LAEFGIGKTIRILRQARDLKLNDLAERSGISTPFLSLIESGERQPSIAVLRRIADSLRIPSEALVFLGLGSNSSLSSADPAITKIANSVTELVEVEDKLKRMLGAEDALGESERNHVGRDRRSPGAD
jgi:transcriptional regulator with XRE-family HTH domain